MTTNGNSTNQWRGRKSNARASTPGGSHQHRQQNQQQDNNRTNQAPVVTGNSSSVASVPKTSDAPYPPHLTIEECLLRYTESINNTNDTNSSTIVDTSSINKTIIRGKLRVLPGLDKSGFVTCDRGCFKQDVVIPDILHRNRALHGDQVYVELIDEDKDNAVLTMEEYEISKAMKQATLLGTKNDESDDDAGDSIATNWQLKHDDTTKEFVPPTTWQDDEIQMDIWNPQITIRRNGAGPREPIPIAKNSSIAEPQQHCGRVVHVVRPKDITSEIGSQGTTMAAPPHRRIVGSLMVLPTGTILLTPNNKSLPQFKCFPQHTVLALIEEIERDHDLKNVLFQAEYEYGSWKQSHRNWPPCGNVKFLGESCVIENEIQALLVDFQVDHGEFSSMVMKDVDSVVQSGLFVRPGITELEWKPTPEMYVGRRDYRKQRIFTIDPTTAKDLDDALHITELHDGSIEIGVHIADVSYFVRPDTAVDQEAIKRATTVYLVDRTVPMLPRPLCEVACSLNENVERLAFSCVWRMNADGSLRKKKAAKGAEEDVWYGRTVIKSCARLDYATAQNIIDNLVALPGHDDEATNEDLWPSSRRPTGGHTMQQVAADVRLMDRVAKARRRLRFENGALALNSIKLSFQLDIDGQTPILAAPYPIRDSNRLIEEYMLLANYLVAQRLITHAGDLACLRHHRPPKIESMGQVASVAKAGMNFDIDISSSQSLHQSLIRFGQVCHDPLLLTCITQMMVAPMQQAQYFAAGTLQAEEWRHFALNMPYYTHFTSPIRRFPDIIVHRLLQATLDGDASVRSFPQDVQQIEQLCVHCSEMQMASKNAQQRCDRVFLSLFIRSHPMESQLGIVVSVGQKAFTAFLPSIGADAILYLEEHRDMLTFTSDERSDKTRRIVLQQRKEAKGTRWKTLEVVVFTKVLVTVVCNEKPPINIKLKLQGPYLK